MYFKQLELIGFKSFAEKTVIRFEPGVTAIVGPNGCGKSNISDSIRWVLGEQSAKSLRGSSMEDVIFNGSSIREPLNLAEVSLTLSNESKILPIEYDEVTITRRLYRSGESEYLLNKNPVRLRDIHELLMGTGIGTESYSLIEQGKMDLILNSRPEDRRVIFEEAAGITKYKSKKKEALRRLEQTETNLLRVNDIIQEVKRQIGSIERQAKRAEHYKVEFEKLKNLELAVASREFLIFHGEKKSKEESLVELQTREAEWAMVVEKLRGECQSKSSGIHRLDELLREAGADEMAAAAEIRKNQDRVLLNRERVGELAERRENLSKQIALSQKRVEEFKNEYENLSAEFELARGEEAEGRRFLDSVEADFAAVDAALAESLSLEKDARQALAGLDKRRTEEAIGLAGVRAEIASATQRLSKLEQRRASVSAGLDEARSALEAALEETRSRAESADPALSERIARFKEKIRSILRGFFEKKISGFSAEHESTIDAEVRSFADDLWRIQGTHTAGRGTVASLEERNKKIEEELGFLGRESAEISAELERLGAAERALTGGRPEADSETKTLLESLSLSERRRAEKAAEKEALLVRLAETRSKQGHFAAKREKIEKDKNWILESIRGQEELVVSYEREAAEAVAKKESLETESASLEQRVKTLISERDELVKRLEGVRRERESALEALDAIENERREKQVFLDEARGKAHALEMQNAEIGFEIDRLKERIFNAYQIDLVAEEAVRDAGEVLHGFATPDGGLDLERAKAQVQAQKEKLNKMGPVNLVAIEEHEEMKQRYEFLTTQEQDLLKAKEDLHQAILKINRTTRELFVETFEKIQKNFSEYFRQLFRGGTAELVLMDDGNVLECGIEIVARPPGKKLQSISLLSGGEKALTATALLFALFKVKPSPFCVLDEIDAPLDETNVDRFCAVLKEFIVGSQFILITHNKRTMSLADVLYGITMAENGTSKVVSVRFSAAAASNGGKEKETKATLVS